MTEKWYLEEDRLIVEESILDEDNRFNPSRVDDGCSSCGSPLAKINPWHTGGEEAYFCDNVEGPCPQAKPWDYYDTPSKKDYDLTVEELLALRKECSALKDAVERYKDMKDFYQRRYKRLKKHIQDSGLTVKELIHREVNKQ
jgi:hypothetical protein